jgi:hypothetical protein
LTHRPRDRSRATKNGPAVRSGVEGRVFSWHAPPPWRPRDMSAQSARRSANANAFRASPCMSFIARGPESLRSPAQPRPARANGSGECERRGRCAVGSVNACATDAAPSRPGHRRRCTVASRAPQTLHRRVLCGTNGGGECERRGRCAVGSPPSPLKQSSRWQDRAPSTFSWVAVSPPRHVGALAELADEGGPTAWAPAVTSPRISIASPFASPFASPLSGDGAAQGARSVIAAQLGCRAAA